MHVKWHVGILGFFGLVVGTLGVPANAKDDLLPEHQIAVSKPMPADPVTGAAKPLRSFSPSETKPAPPGSHASEDKPRFSTVPGYERDSSKTSSVAVPRQRTIEVAPAPREVVHFDGEWVEGKFEKMDQSEYYQRYVLIVKDGSLLIRVQYYRGDSPKTLEEGGTLVSNWKFKKDSDGGYSVALPEYNMIYKGTYTGEIQYSRFRLSEDGTKLSVGSRTFFKK
jgi:hypothetical protein